VPDEATFRAALDDRGILRPGALASPSPSFLVFAQRSDAFVDVAAWQGHARRFFATDLGLTTEKRYATPLPTTDAARIVVVCGDEHGTRLAFARPRTDDDLRQAEAAEARAPAGLALLAKRCPTVWLVEAATPDDRIALRIAAILASVLLGPIMPPARDAIFGVKTARLTLSA